MPLTMTLLRELPLSMWERSARSHVDARLAGPARYAADGTVTLPAAAIERALAFM